MRICFVVMVFFFSHYSTLLAAGPVISKDPADIWVLTSASEFTFKGIDFGVGPSILLFDNFEQNKIADSNVSLTGLVKGAWTKYGDANEPTAAITAHSGIRSMAVFNAGETMESQYFMQLQKTFPEPITEIYFSYWVKIPTGTYFPAATAVNTMSSRSAWKMMWLMDGDKGYLGDDDFILPTWVGAKWYMGGNDGLVYSGSPNDWKTEVKISQDWFSFTNWMRISGWMRVDDYDLTAVALDENAYNSDMYIEFINEDVSISIQEETDVRFMDGDDTSFDNNVSQWTKINIPGWIVPGTQNNGKPVPNCRPVYDDIYIATGVNALARVEIGDDIDFKNCKHREIQIVEKWSVIANNEQKIEITVNSGSFQNEAAFLFVVDRFGNASKGVPITIQ